MRRLARDQAQLAADHLLSQLGHLDAPAWRDLLIRTLAGEEPTPQRTITRPQYWELIGLLLLAGQHNQALAQIQLAACDLLGIPEHSGTGEPGGDGHIADAVYGETTAAQLLDRLNIIVEQEPPCTQES